MRQVPKMNILLVSSLGVFAFACNRGLPPAKGKPPIATGKIAEVRPTAKSTSNGITIEDLKEDETFSGAGAAFSLASAPANSDGIIFGYSGDDDATGVRVNGQLYKLKQTDSKILKKGKDNQSLGEHRVDTWAGDGIVVEFDYTITSVGEGGAGFKGQVSIKLNNKKATFKITGGAGC